MCESKTLKIRNITIGQGMPKICVPIVGKSRREILEEAERLAGLPVDMAEWRLDYYEQAEDYPMVQQTLKQLREILPDMPLLCTFRTRREGGERTITAEGYRGLYEAIGVTGLCDLIDVELFAGETLEASSGFRNPLEDFFREMVALAHGYGLKVIASSHDFHKTPDVQELILLLCRMQALGADIAKAAVMPQSPGDVDALMNATIHMSREYARIPIVTMAMGELGTISRMNGQLTGSAITFGTVSRASAPGQIPVGQLKKALEMIDASQSRSSGSNLYLIGFMGTGKTSVSGALHQKLGYEEIDTDARIRQEQGMSISDIFQEKGEAFFRQLETDCLKSLQGTEGKVISCGGGMAVKPENAALMKQNGKVILLTAAPETVLERVREDDSRPILQGHKNVQDIARLMERRRQAYENAADITIATDGKTVAEIADEIISIIAN